LPAIYCLSFAESSTPIGSELIIAPLALLAITGQIPTNLPTQPTHFLLPHHPFSYHEDGSSMFLQNDRKKIKLAT
jgi:hypothetical protein